MAKVIEFIHGALEIAVKIQAASGPKLVDFKVNCIICIFWDIATAVPTDILSELDL